MAMHTWLRTNEVVVALALDDVMNRVVVLAVEGCLLLKRLGAPTQLVRAPAQRRSGGLAGPGRTLDARVAFLPLRQ